MLAHAAIQALHFSPLLAEQKEREGYIVQKEWEQLKAQIEELYRQGQYRELVPLMERAVRLAGKLYGLGSLTYAAMLNDYGGVHRDIGNYQQAEEAYLEAKELLLALMGEKDLNYGNTLNNLAGLYRLMGQRDKAESMFLQALALYRELLGEEDFLTISGLNNLGLLYQDMGKYDQAEALHRQSLALIRRGDDTEIAYATTLNNLASALRAQEKLADAGPLLAEALDIYERALGREHSLYAYGLNNLAAYYFTISSFEQAAECYYQSLASCRKLFGTHSRNYVVSLRNLATTLERLGRKDEADRLQSEAQEIMQALGEVK